MDQFYKFATGPEALPDQFFGHIGRGAVVADLGGVSMMLCVPPRRRTCASAASTPLWPQTIRVVADG
eukprot:2520947-Prymnesium_polylepis.1